MALTTISPALQDTQAQYTGFKNRIINGAMMIDQRNAGASVTIPAGAGTYTLDRWRAYSTNASKFSVQQTPSATETGYATRVAAGFTNYLAVTSLAATSVGAGDQYILDYFIEGFNVADLVWGTPSAKTITLSFWVNSSLTGTFGGAFQNALNNRSYPFSYTINAANTWEYKTITVAGDTSGTWAKDNGRGISLRFGLGIGSTFSGPAGSWAAAEYYSATGATSVVSTSGATFYITGVQLEKGSTATSFDYRPYGTELALCQRYYEKFTNDSRYLIGYYQESAYIYTPIQFLVEKRASPTVTLPAASSFDVWAVGAPSVIATQATTTRSALIRFSSAGTNYYSYGLLGNSSSVFQFSAEL